MGVRHIKAAKNYIMREIVGETVLVPVGEAARDNNDRLVIMTESGALLWRSLEEEKTREELVEILLNEYEVDPETASRDVDEFSEQMREAGLLE